MEDGRVADVKVLAELGRQHPLLEIPGHARQGDLEVAGEVEGRAVFTVPALHCVPPLQAAIEHEEVAGLQVRSDRFGGVGSP